MKKLALLVLSLVAAVTVSNAQVCALKSNALTIAVGSVNLGAEFSVAPQWTVDVSGTAVIANPWKNLKVNGWDAVLEGRYYFCRAFNGHHVGGFVQAARYGETDYPNGDKSINDKVLGLGVSYGYYLKLNTFWGLDLNAGAGVGYELENNNGLRFLPRLQASFSYKF